MLFDEKICLLVIIYVFNVFGIENLLVEMIMFVYQYGVKVLVDGVQVVMYYLVDVQVLDCDFYVFFGYKLYGFIGIGIFYVKEVLLQEMLLWEGGGFMIVIVSLSEGIIWIKVLWWFEVGIFNIGGIIGFGAVLEYVLVLGFNNIVEYEQNLMYYVLLQLEFVLDFIFYGL